MKYFITGTGTGIGKTYFSMLFCKYLKDQGRKVKYIKPVQTGYPDDDDALEVRKFAGLSETDAVVLNTAKPPVAPCLVFDKFPTDKVVEYINSVDGYDDIVVESAGGISVPLDYETPADEIAKRCGLSIICVVPDRLGCVNEVNLNLAYIKMKELDFCGFAMNGFFAETETSRNAEIIEKLHPGSIKFSFNRSLVELK